MYKWFNNLNKITRLILLFPIWGWIFAGVYRISKYLGGKRNVVTLVFGILFIVPFIGFFGSIIDMITTFSEDKIVFLAE